MKSVRASERMVDGGTGSCRWRKRKNQREEGGKGSRCRARLKPVYARPTFSACCSESPPVYFKLNIITPFQRPAGTCQLFLQPSRTLYALLHRPPLPPDNTLPLLSLIPNLTIPCRRWRPTKTTTPSKARDCSVIKNSGFLKG